MSLGGAFGALACCAALSGCFCADVARSPVLGRDVEAHVIVTNYGWSLFGCIPIVCGNRNEDSWCPFAFFRDDVKLEYVHGRLEKLAKSTGCGLRDVTVLSDNDVLFDAYYSPVPWIVVYREVNVSANLVREGAK